MATNSFGHVIDECLKCFRTCSETISYCVQTGGKHAEPNHLRDLRDCTTLCLATADLLTRRSSVAAAISSTCAGMCAQCATNCETMFPGDERMAHCAAICRECGEACRQIGSMQHA